MATVVMFVILRLSLGFHFFYEGVWKIKHSDIFSAAPFLSEAKGPVSPLFYAMLPDLEGRQRLGISEDGQGNVEIAADTDEKGRTVYRVSAYIDAWKDLKDRVVRDYRLDDDQQKRAETVFNVFKASAQEYVADHADAIAAHFKSRQRLREQLKEGNGAAFQAERDWKRERELRKEMNDWLGELDSMSKSYQLAMWDVLGPDQQAKGPISKGWNPLFWARGDQINFAVTYGLTAIGLCLLLGFFTRLAALGGGAFMMFVVMTQPAWPGLYPPDPPVVGHALLVNKDFVEMVALFLVATTAVGRWGGLDYFVHHLLVRPFLAKSLTSNKQEG